MTVVELIKLLQRIADQRPDLPVMVYRSGQMSEDILIEIWNGEDGERPHVFIA